MARVTKQVNRRRHRVCIPTVEQFDQRAAIQGRHLLEQLGNSVNNRAVRIGKGGKYRLPRRFLVFKADQDLVSGQPRALVFVLRRFQQRGQGEIGRNSRPG